METGLGVGYLRFIRFPIIKRYYGDSVPYYLVAGLSITYFSSSKETEEYFEVNSADLPLQDGSKGIRDHRAKPSS